MWIELDGAVNARDLGGLPTIDGSTIRTHRLLRSDNLQDLTPADVSRLVDGFGLRHVIDLRSDAEVKLEGPGPLAEEPRVRIHALSLFAEGGQYTDVEADTNGIDADKVLPWADRNDTRIAEGQRTLTHYLAYLAERPDSVVAALRTISDGTSIVHCAAGKDRTGVVVALALSVAGVEREAIVEDYAATGERLEAILARLRSSSTYAGDLDSRPADSHLPRPETMRKFLERLDERHDGPLGWLAEHGWTPADTVALRDRLTT
jgi:protein tyrosine/serine phosphatase